MESSKNILSSPSCRSKQLKRILFASREIPSFLTHLIFIIQITSLIVLCDPHISNYIYNSSDIFKYVSMVNSNYFMIGQILLVLFVQLFLDVSIVRASYLRCLYSFSKTDIMEYAVLVLTALALALDFMKTTSTLIVSRNQFSEPYN